jgi:hypothetical protein
MSEMYSNASKQLLRTQQIKDIIRYVVTPSTNTAALPIMASGIVGSVTTPTCVAVSVSSFVPPTAMSIIVNPLTGHNGQILVAPNNNYGNQDSTTNPPYYGLYNPGGSNIDAIPVEIMLESTSIYWASSVSSLLACIGWKTAL